MSVFGCASDEQFFDEALKDYSEIVTTYRVRMDVFGSCKYFISKEAFKSYQEAYDYGHKSLVNFPSPCGFSVIKSEEINFVPEIDFSKSEFPNDV